MTTRSYVWLVSSVCAAFVLAAAWLGAVLHASHERPARPATVPSTALWRPTPTETLSLRAHGDWVDCWDEGQADHCRLADATGVTEYEAAFVRLPDRRGLPNAQLHPVISETIQPWMWSSHAGKLVPLIHLANGAVLAPKDSGMDLGHYVERTRMFGVHVKPLPIYAQYYHPAGGGAKNY